MANLTKLVWYEDVRYMHKSQLLSFTFMAIHINRFHRNSKYFCAESYSKATAWLTKWRKFLSWNLVYQKQNLSTQKTATEKILSDGSLG